MHEFALVQRIIDTCNNVAKRNNASQIAEINLEVGDFSLIIDSMLQHSFEILQKGTIAETAKLIIVHTPGVILCEDCDETSEIWFAEEKNKKDDTQNTALSEYEKTITPTQALTGNSDFGRNLFQCRQCKSHNTNLIKGKSIIIKNIRI